MPQETSAERLARIRARRQSSTSRGSVISRGWRAISTPLTDLPSRVSRDVSRRISSLREDTENPFLAGTIGFAEGATEGLGDFLTDLTSPIDAAATLAPMTSPFKSIRRIAQGANALSAARGVSNMADAVTPDPLTLTDLASGKEKRDGLDWAQFGAGALETGLAGLGFKTTLKPKPATARPRNTQGGIATSNVSNRSVQPPSALESPSTDQYGIVRNTSRNAPNAARNTYGIRASSIDPQTGAPIPERLRSSTNQRVIDALLPSRTRELIRADAPILKGNESNVDISSAGIGNQTSLPTNPNTRRQSAIKKGSSKLKGTKTPKVAKPVKPAISQEQFVKDLTAAGFSPEDAKLKWTQRFGSETGSFRIKSGGPLREPTYFDAYRAIKNDLTLDNRSQWESMIDDSLKAMGGDTSKWVSGKPNPVREGVIQSHEKRLITKGDSGALRRFFDDETGSASIDLLSGNALKNSATKIKDTFNLNMINNPAKVVQKLKPHYQSWVNERSSRLGHSYNVKQDFKDLEKSGLDGIFAYNAGDRTGRFADVERWFNQKHAEFTAVKKALGSKHQIGFKENYLPQIWDNSPEEIAAAFGKKRLGLRSRIEMTSIIKDYQEGIAKGLTPKYKNIPELMGYYAETMEKNIADTKFFNALRDNGLLKRDGAKGTDGWTPLTRDMFPVIHTNKGKMHWSAPPEVAEIIENYLKPRGKVAQTYLRGTQLTKDIALASGLPGTAFNAHGFNMLRRSAVASGIKGFVPGLMKGLKYMSKSGSDKHIASRFLDKVLPWESAHARIERSRDIIPEIMRYGGKLGVEGHEFDQKLANTALGQTNKLVKGAAKGIDWLGDKHNKWFETHLFDKMIPALKIDFWESSVKELVDNGIAPEMAKKEAARAMNLAFSGINYDELATNKQVLDLARAFLLAPDWYASNIGLTKEAVKSLLNPNTPGGRIYRNAANGILSAYVGANVLNAALTKYNEGEAKLMFQNESGRSFDIDTGTYTVNEEGVRKKVYISPFGTAFDAMKIPAELLVGLFKGDIDKLPSTLKNRTSLPVHSGINFLSNTNDFGERMFGEDVYGRDIPLSRELGNLSADVLARPLTPSYMNAVRGYASGRMNPMEAGLNAIEAPVIFKRQDSNTRRRRRRTRSR